MTDDLERQFAERGVTRGGVTTFPASVAYEVIAAAERAGQPILGVDGMILTESTTESPLEHILDLSRGEPDGVSTWCRARHFIKEREPLNLFFEIVV